MKTPTLTPASLAALGSAMAMALPLSHAQAQSRFAPTATEYERSTAVRQLNLSGIHAQGILGRGVVVGVLDTGLNTRHPEFAGSGRLMTGYNASNGSTDVSDDWGHGTHVAGIIAASANGSGMYGVAPGATLLPVKVFGGVSSLSSACSASTAEMDRGLLYAASHGARVINMSLGGDKPTGSAALTRIAYENRTLVVVAAGNGGQANPAWPARYAKEGWANGSLIAVGAVDANRNILAFSNRAGDAAEFYLVAPGSGIHSTYGSSGYASMSGTSMAAPAVSGAAALVLGYWPYLKATQVAAILLNTADDLGAKGTDPIYGRGMLNVARALSPQGSINYRTSAGTAAVVSLTNRSVITSQPHVTSPTAFGGLITQVYDDYGRNFSSNEGAALSATTQMTADSLLGRSDRMLESAERTLPGGARLQTLQMRTADFKRNDAGTAHLLKLQWAGGHQLTAGDGGLAPLGLGLMASNMASQLAGGETLLSNPLLGFAPNHRFASLGLPLGKGWSTHVALVRSPTSRTEADRAHADVNVFELMHQGEQHAVNLSTGCMSEQGLLGGYSNTALGLAQTTSTTGLTLSGAMNLNQVWRLLGSYSAARTHAPKAGGMLMSATQVKSGGYGLGLLRADNWREGDRLSLMFNAPLRATSGALNYQVIDSVSLEDGTPHYAMQTVNLRPEKREWVAEVRYQARLSATSSMSAVAAHRQNPDHDATAPNQTAIGLRYQLTF